MVKVEIEEQTSSVTEFTNASKNVGGDANIIESYESKLKHVNIIAAPMASQKLAKKCYKLLKKAIKHRTYVRNGLKDVQQRLRKGEVGIVVFAGDITPIEVMCHLPAICEERGIPYIYTPSRVDLGAAMGVKRGTVVVLIREHEDYKDLMNEVRHAIAEHTTIPF